MCCRFKKSNSNKDFFFQSIKSHNARTLGSTVHQHNRQWSFEFSKSSKYCSNTAATKMKNKPSWARFHVRGKQRQKHSERRSGRRATLREVRVSTEAVTDAGGCPSCYAVWHFLSGSTPVSYVCFCLLLCFLHGCHGNSWPAAASEQLAVTRCWVEAVCKAEQDSAMITDSWSAPVHLRCELTFNASWRIQRLITHMHAHTQIQIKTETCTRQVQWLISVLGQSRFFHWGFAIWGLLNVIRAFPVSAWVQWGQKTPINS